MLEQANLRNILPSNFETTFICMLFFEHNRLLHCKRSALRLLMAFYIGKNPKNRFFLYNCHCLLAANSQLYISFRYYFFKKIVAFFHSLSFFTLRVRIIYLRFESLLNKIYLRSFCPDFFCYNRAILTPSIIIPFNRYLLRLDMYSFFFLWSGIEGIRISFYNNYLKAHPGLWERPHLRHTFTQSWFPRRHGYVPLRGLKILHLIQFDSMDIREVMSARFSIMFKYKKYIILNLLHSDNLYFTHLPLSAEAQFVLKKDATIYWLTAVSAIKTPIKSLGLGFFISWNWPQACRLFFSFFMSHPKRYHLDKWRIKRYFHYLLEAMIEVPDTAYLFLRRSMVDYSMKYTKRAYRNLFLSSAFELVFFFQDLYNYSSFSWENFASFIDRHFCYRVFVMKFNWFFDNYFLESYTPYMSVIMNFQRPFKRKDSSTYAVPRKRALSFAKRLLLRLCDLPVHFSYLMLGLEYYYWRIYELDAISRCLDFILPISYYYIKLDIDRLVTSRYRVMVEFFRAFIRTNHFSVYQASYWKYRNVDSAAFGNKRWMKTLTIDFVNPWMLFHFSALKSIFLQSLNSNFFLTIISFFLVKPSLLVNLTLDLNVLFFKRLEVCFVSVEIFYNYVTIDEVTFLQLGVDWDAPRSKKMIVWFRWKKYLFYFHRFTLWNKLSVRFRKYSETVSRLKSLMFCAVAKPKRLSKIKPKIIQPLKVKPLVFRKPKMIARSKRIFIRRLAISPLRNAVSLKKKLLRSKLAHTYKVLQVFFSISQQLRSYSKAENLFRKHVSYSNIENSFKVPDYFFPFVGEKDFAVSKNLHIKDIQSFKANPYFIPLNEPSFLGQAYSRKRFRPTSRPFVLLPITAKRRYSPRPLQGLLSQLPLWLLQFLQLSFVFSHFSLKFLWINLFFFRFVADESLALKFFLVGFGGDFFQRSFNLQSSSFKTYLYDRWVYDSWRFLPSYRSSLNDLDREATFRRSPWVLTKRVWKRFDSEVFEVYKNRASFYNSCLLLSFDYRYSVKFVSKSPLLFSNIKLLRK